MYKFNKNIIIPEKNILNVPEDCNNILNVPEKCKNVLNVPEDCNNILNVTGKSKTTPIFFDK